MLPGDVQERLVRFRASTILAILGRPGELAFGYDIWQAVKNWALP